MKNKPAPKLKPVNPQALILDYGNGPKLVGYIKELTVDSYSNTINADMAEPEPDLRPYTIKDPKRPDLWANILDFGPPDIPLPAEEARTTPEPGITEALLNKQLYIKLDDGRGLLPGTITEATLRPNAENPNSWIVELTTRRIKD